MKVFTTAPLPFQGQKRMWQKHIKNTLTEQFGESFIYVDLFGGSGLVSHIIKQHFPASKVIYNDFDNFSARLKNICRTNTLLADIREIVKDLPKEAKITGEAKTQIIARLEAETGFADWITISSWLCFSMNYALSLDELIKQTFYNSVRKTDYNGAATPNKAYCLCRGVAAPLFNFAGESAKLEVRGFFIALS